MLLSLQYAFWRPNASWWLKFSWPINVDLWTDEGHEHFVFLGSLYRCVTHYIVVQAKADCFISQEVLGNQLSSNILLLFKNWNAILFQPWNWYQLRVTHQQSCWVNQRAEQQGFSYPVPLPQFLWQILFFRLFIFPRSCKAKTPNWIETSSVNCAGVSSVTSELFEGLLACGQFSVKQGKNSVLLIIAGAQKGIEGSKETS